MTELYRCDKCKKIYQSRNDAILCEMLDFGWEEGIAKIIASGLDTCEFCKGIGFQRRTDETARSRRF